MTTAEDSAVADASEFPAAAGSEAFYRRQGASAIMRVSHFPDELLSFLQLELLATREAITRFRCDTVVELGCYDGRALEVARVAKVPYLGVDVNRRAIDALVRRIVGEGLQRQAVAVHGSALDSGAWRHRIVGRHPLQVVPFNLMGNFPEPRELLHAMSQVGAVALVSVFNGDPWTTQVRRAYYAACGIDLLSEEPGDHGGVLFRGASGFHSQSFGREGFAALIAGFGVTVLAESSNRLGRCVVMAFD